jgi:cytochrome c-type biogenesis protein CcmH/NrfG
MRRHLPDVADSIRTSKEFRQKGCTLLIGAGCSVTAGIPTAGEFVEIIRQQFKTAYARALPKTYPYVMAQLSRAERHYLIRRHIASAKLNWGHLAIAQLLKNGYVDRVLTVNFDPLLMRACSLVGVFPAVYDFAASQNFKSDLIAPQSIFYLHGQHTGFVLLNTPQEVKKFSRRLQPVWENSVEGRVCIVVGYSGDNDPVFDQLAKIRHFDNLLYWICYKETAPQAHVQKKLLTNGKDCFFVQGYDADDFFVTLAQELNCFPPEFVETPFTHLENLLELVLPYSLPGRQSGLEAIPKKLLRDAIEKIEKPAKLALRASNLLLSGDFESVIAMGANSEEMLPDELAELIAWGYIAAGNKIVSEAETNKGEEADKLWAAAGDKYEAALRIDPKKDAALYNWGRALSLQASRTTGEEANRLLALAAEKYAAALEIKPNKFEALFNWAALLAYQAHTKTGDEADALWSLAREKYSAALDIKPESADVLYDWGGALMTQASTKSGHEANRLWAEASEKYQAAVNLKPDNHQALNNWGRVLTAQAELKRSEESDGLWTALVYEPKTQSDEEVDKLWTLAQEKYAAALEIKPDKFAALYNWAASLVYRARTKGGAEADRLWELAGEKYEAALKVKPDSDTVLYDWGVALMMQAETKSGDDADTLRVKASKKFKAALKLKPDKHQALYNWATVLSGQAKTKVGKEADRLWALARQKYEAALEIKPDKHQALCGLSLVIRSQAETKTGPSKERLLELADEKLAAARAIAPKLYSSK